MTTADVLRRQKQAINKANIRPLRIKTNFIASIFQDAGYRYRLEHPGKKKHLRRGCARQSLTELSCRYIDKLTFPSQSQEHTHRANV